MSKQKHHKDNNQQETAGWVTSTLLRFGKQDDITGEVFTKDTQFTLPDGTVVEKGKSYNLREHGVVFQHGEFVHGDGIGWDDRFDVVMDEYGAYLYPKGYIYPPKKENGDG